MPYWLLGDDQVFSHHSFAEPFVRKFKMPWAKVMQELHGCVPCATLWDDGGEHEHCDLISTCYMPVLKCHTVHYKYVQSLLNKRVSVFKNQPIGAGIWPTS